MRYKTAVTTPVKVLDFDRVEVTRDEVLAQLDGLTCASDTVLNYLAADISSRDSLRGGFPKLAFDRAKRKLRLVVEIDSLHKLTPKEVKGLREDLHGQLTDGIGAGCFSELSAKTGLSIEMVYPLRLACTQAEGAVRLPAKGAAAANERKYAALQRQIKKQDRQERTSAPKQPASAAPSPASPPSGDFKALFRLLSKVDRDKQLPAIKQELAAAGGDLRGVRDRQLPSGNWTSARLLKLLLDHGLNPELLDDKGYTMLNGAAGSSDSVQLLLDRGANVNRQSEDPYRETPLMRAAFLGSLKSIELLLAAGADPNVEGAFGKTALTQVTRHTRNGDKVKALLLKAGAKQ